MSQFHVASLDLIALGWSLLCWSLFALVSERQRLRQPSLHEAIYSYREQWMLRVLERDNRIADASLMSNLMSSVSFFASTSAIIIGGLVAALGATDQAIAVIGKLPLYRTHHGGNMDTQGDAAARHLRLCVLQVHLVAASVQSLLYPDRGRTPQGQRQ